MKIGILTYFNVPNFGAQLQAASTVGFLRRLGHDPILLDWLPDDLEAMYAARVSEEQRALFSAFVRDYLPVSRRCRIEEELVAEIRDLGIEAVIEGSDALFKYVPRSKRTYLSLRRRGIVRRPVLSVEDLPGNAFWGAWNRSDLPLAAYSVSSQNMPWHSLRPGERRALRDAIQRFDSISVRDAWTQEFVRRIGGREAAVTPDPVFGFNQNARLPLPSKEELLQRYGLPSDYVLISFRKSIVTRDYVQNLASRLRGRGLTPVAFPMPEGLQDFGLSVRVEGPLPTLDWYALIKYSRGYIGERMHPIIVCLHNSVPFFSFDEYGPARESKTFDILSRAGFQDNWCSYQAALPPTATVIGRLTGFDFFACTKAADLLWKEYKYSFSQTVERLMEPRPEAKPLRVVYYSSMPFMDCDFPLIREYQRAGADVHYYIPLLPGKGAGPLFRIRQEDPRSAILPCTDYPEFQPFAQYMDLSQTRIVNRRRRGAHPANLLLYLRLLREWRRLKPDVVHITYPPSGPEILLYLMRKRLTLTVHDPFSHSGEHWSAKERQRRIAFRLIRNLILLNESQRDDFVREYRIRSRILVNRLGAYDTLRELSGPAAPAAPSPAPYVLFFGRISRYKGIEYLCEAMKSVHERLPELRCVIAGSGEYYFDTTPYEGLGYIDFQRRFFSGEEVTDLIKGAMFLVCPYTDATQSGVVSSAFAYDKPVIASNVGGLRESVIPDVTGLLVPPRDPSALAETIVALAGEPARLEALTATLRDTCRAGALSWKEIAAKNLDFYRAPAGDGPKPAQKDE